MIWWWWEFCPLNHHDHLRFKRRLHSVIWKIVVIIVIYLVVILIAKPSQSQAGPFWLWFFFIISRQSVRHVIMAFKILNLAIGYLLRIKERERWICNLNIFILLCLPLLGMILQWDVWWWWWWWEWRLHSINDFGSLDFELHCRLSSCWYYILKKIERGRGEERACVHAFGIIVFYNGINIPADLYQIYLSICSICCQSGRDWKDDDDEKNESCLTPIWKTYMFCRHRRQRTSKEMICVQKIFLVYWLDIHNT